MTHFDTDITPGQPVAARRRRGHEAYFAGVSAEDSVVRHYESRGAVTAARRWRGSGGEIDLVAFENDVVVFVEVKKGRSFESALHHLSEVQMMRIHAAASEYLGTTPKGQLTEVRFDLALVDQSGQIRVMKDAFGHF